MAENTLLKKSKKFIPYDTPENEEQQMNVTGEQLEKKLRFNDNQFETQLETQSNDESDFILPETEASLSSLHRTLSMTNRYEPDPESDDIGTIQSTSTSGSKPQTSSAGICHISINSQPITDVSIVSESTARGSKAFTNMSESLASDSTFVESSQLSELKEPFNVESLVKSISQTDFTDEHQSPCHLENDQSSNTSKPKLNAQNYFQIVDQNRSEVEYLNYNKIMSSAVAASVVGHRIAGGGGSVGGDGGGSSGGTGNIGFDGESDQLQKSIFSQSIPNTQYRLLVSDQSAPEILSVRSPTNGQTIVSADIHATYSNSEIASNRFEQQQADILATFSSTVSKPDCVKELDTNRSRTPHEEVDSTAYMQRLHLIRTDGLDGAEISGSSVSSDEDEKKKPIIKQPQMKEATDDISTTGIELPTIHENASQISETSSVKRKPRMWASKNGLPTSLESLDRTNLILVEIAKQIPSKLLQFNPNKDQVFILRNRDGEIMFYAIEHPIICPIGTCSSGRPFQMHLYNPKGDEVILFSRKASCLVGGCLLPCLWQTIRVFSPPPVIIGSVEEDITWLAPKFTVYNSLNEAEFSVRGPVGASIFKRNIDFLCYRHGEYTHEGIITDNWWQDVVAQNYSDTFGVKFPIDATARAKVLLLASAILIKHIYFDRDIKLQLPELLPETELTTTEDVILEAEPIKVPDEEEHKIGDTETVPDIIENMLAKEEKLKIEVVGKTEIAPNVSPIGTPVATN